MEKLKAGIFDSPQIREPMKDLMFDKALSKDELSAWQSLKNNRSVEYEKEIEELLKSFCQLGARASVKLYFLQLHLDYFPKNCGDLSEEKGECFHLDIRIMKECYPGQWDVNFLGEYCWCWKWDEVATEHKRKSLKRLFIHEYLLLCIFQFTMAQCELSTYIYQP